MSGTFNTLSQRYPEFAFVTVYIREAHASDEWPLGAVCSRPQHTSIDQRIAAAKEFVSEYKYALSPVVVDTMENKFNDVFSVWPERYFVVCDGALDFMASASSEQGIQKSWLLERLDHLQQFYRLLNQGGVE